MQTQAENAGAQEISRLLARGLQARGHRVKQVFFFRRTAAFDDDPDALFCCARRPGGPLAVARFLLRLRAMIGSLKPDALVSFQHYGNLIAAPIARAVGVPVIIANHVSAQASVSRAVARGDALIGRLGAYDAIVVNSRETEAVYARYAPAYARRLTRIDHGFAPKSSPLGKTAARAALGLPQDAPLLGCAARLHPLKRLDAAIATLVFNASHHLALAGEGADRARLAALAQQLGVAARVHWLGELPASSIGVFLAALDVFVFPSAAETFGLAPVEAAQAGVLVIAADLPILKDVLQVDGAPCALFAEVTDAAAFAAIIAAGLADQAGAALLRERGRRLADKYPLHVMVDSYARLIETLAARADAH